MTDAAIGLWGWLIPFAVIAVVAYSCGYRHGVDSEHDRIERWRRTIERTARRGGEGVRSDNDG